MKTIGERLDDLLDQQTREWLDSTEIVIEEKEKDGSD